MSADVHGLSGAYAVWALDDDERAEFEQHLAVCAECREEVASLRETAAALADSTATTPPPSLRASVLGEITSIRPVPPDLPAQVPTRIGSPRRPVVWLGSMAAAVAVIVGALVSQPWAADLSPAERVMSADDAHRYSLVVDGATVQVWRSESRHGAVVVTKNLPAAPTGRDYQLWFQVPDGRTGSRMVSAGLLPRRHGETVTTVLTGDAAKATGAGITLEPAGGSAQPTTTPIALFEF